MDRIKTGVAALDDLLQGGFPEGAAILIAGMPGVGKSILANQMAFFNASNDSKVIYLSTLSEPQIKILKFQQECCFFDYEKFQKTVIYQDLGGILRKKGYSQAIAFIDNLLRQHQPKLIVIDTIKTLTDMIPSIMEFREFLLDLSLRIATWGCTTLLLGEYAEDEIQNRPESAIVDGILYMYGTEERSQQRRYLRILKMRGTDCPGGEIRFKISHNGINVYPRLNPNVMKQRYVQYEQRITTGIPGLDELMDGGIPKGSTTLLSGASGTGKTMVALHIAYDRLQANEEVLFVSFEENPAQIKMGAGRMTLDFEPYLQLGQLTLQHVSPIELDVDELLWLIQEKVDKMSAGLVIIDSISAFEIGMSNKNKYTDCIWALADYLKMAGINCLLVHEIHDSLLMTEVTKHGISFIADNIITLRYLEENLQIKRFLRILKMRSSNHSTMLKEVLISTRGLCLGDVVN